MDNHHLRAIILKLQDRLSDNDRRRLHFFLGNDVPRRIRDDPSLSGTLCLMESLFDQDKINEQDFTFLINAFDEIQCLDAVKLLREHMKRIQSHEVNQPVQSLTKIMSHTIDQSVQDQVEDKIALPSIFIDEKNNFTSYNTMIEQKTGYDNNIMMTDRDITRVNSVPVVVNSRSTVPTSNDLFKKSSITNKYSLIFAVLTVILAMALIGLIVGMILLKSELKTIQLSCLQEQVDSNETIRYLKELQMRDNETAQELTKKTKHLEEQLQITISTTCSCHQWCKEHGSPYGVCGDDPTCICRHHPIKKENIGDECTCDAWCRKYGHKNGGICGDGHTCICSS